MLLRSFQPTTTSPKIKATPEKVRGMLELLGIDSSKCDKYKVF